MKEDTAEAGNQMNPEDAEMDDYYDPEEDPANEGKVPVFVINGFLEAGKTQFLKFTMEQPYFRTDGKTLLLVCEEGELEYEEDFLRRERTAGIFFESPDEVTPEQLHALQREYNPERVLVEWNGMWQPDILKLPEEWFLNQQITVFDTSTLDLYLKNMRPLMGPMLKDSELVICNRADGIPEEQLGAYHLALRGMAPNAQIVFEGKEGEIRGDFSIELPYDLKKDLIDIRPEDYGIFYVDAMDRTEKYDGKTVTVTVQVLRPRGAPDGMFVGGRRVMTCCEADTQFMGFLCRYRNAGRLANGSWVKVKGVIRKEDCREYGGPGPVLYVETIAMTSPIDEIASF